MSAPTADPTTAPAPSNPEPAPAPRETPPEPKAGRTFTQDEVNAIVEDRLARAARAAQDDQDRRDRDANEARLAEQNEFRTLAEQRAERIVELEAATGQVETVTQERDAALAVVRQLVTAELEAAPDYVRDAIAERSPVAQLEYLNQHRDKWTNDGRRGIPPTPRGQLPGPVTRDDIKNKYLEQAGVRRQ